MKAYEGLFMFPPDAAPDAQKAQVQQVEDLIKKVGGTISEKTDLGRRSLGYAVDKFREAAMWSFVFQIDSVKATEFRKSLELQEGLIKYLLTVKSTRPVKKVEAKAAPAATTAPAAPARPSSQPTAAR